MNRFDGRKTDELRPVKIVKDFTRYAEGSVLIEWGNTKVRCNASVEESVPPFKKGSGEGWVTAEYSMLPRATATRNKRDINKLKLNQRSTEIQRLIGRALRAAVDFTELGERSITVDCDVLQADGGTRTASITGGFVALAMACRKLVAEGLIEKMPLHRYISAVSVGVVDGVAMTDLCYEEDSAAAVDMNIIMTDEGNFVEVQGTGEHGTFTQEQLLELLALGRKGAGEVEALQQAAGKDVKTASGIVAEKAKTIKSVSDRQTSIQMKDTTYLNPAREEKKSIAEKIEESSGMDAFDRKNQMAVLSNTTSEEDYAKMQEEGFSLDSTDSHTIITVTDKIKMQLAKAGKEVFGDDLDAAELEAMTGSVALANQLEQAFKEADLPATDENIATSIEAFEQLQMLQPMTDGAIKYMLDNQLQPTIENLYMAQFSGSAGYTGQTVEDMEQLSGQIQNMLSSMGLPVNENTMADCQWLIQNDVPLTEENLTYYENLKTLELPADPSQAMGQIADAITQGNMPKDAMVAEGYSLRDQAQNAADVIENATDEDVAYVVNNGMELTVDNLAKAAENRGKDAESDSQNQKAYTDKGLELLTAKRPLEEVSLAMSAEANYALLKKGISPERIRKYGFAFYGKEVLIG